MPRRKAPTPKRPTATTLAPSALHIRLEGLEAEHQRLLKQIKKKRTELDNFVEQMRSIATQIYHRSVPVREKIIALDQEIHTFFAEILSRKKLGKQTKHKIEQIYLSLQVAGIISPKEDDDDAELDELFESQEEGDKFDSSEYRQHQSESELESPSAARSDESKKIRTYFLRLAEIFHPDKATDSETQVRHTEIMKEINKAYQDGDLARLLEIEQQHEVGETIDTNNEDDLSRKCARIEQQNQFLKAQHETLKRELRSIKKTPEGEMVGEFRKVEKHGFDPMTELSSQMETQITVIAEIRDYVRDFHWAKMTIKDFLRGPQVLRSISQDMMEEMLEQMFEEMYE